MPSRMLLLGPVCHHMIKKIEAQELYFRRVMAAKKTGKLGSQRGVGLNPAP